MFCRIRERVREGLGLTLVLGLLVVGQGLWLVLGLQQVV